MTDLKDLIARQRAKIEQRAVEPLDVVVDGEVVHLTFSRISTDDWQQLVAEHPPRTFRDTEQGRPKKLVYADSTIGYNQHKLPRDYPAASITVNGDDVDQSTWAELYSVLATAHQNNVGTVIWGLNVFDAITELENLGKAEAGSLSSLPANRASRRGGSKASSPQK